ncbi:sulfite exporter TauE/SafE family protein [bacterium]|nr:sulfite exporter TauE/SafE family protein [bacterium]
MVEFAVSGVETHWWLPFLTAMVISTLTSVGGLSGAFLLLPFQMSVLGFVSPAVTPTNLLFNVVAIPSGVYRYIREGRMVWPITWAVVIGTLPGVIGGVFIRVTLLPDPTAFKLFVAAVLGFVGFRLLQQVFKGELDGTGKRGSFRVSEEYFGLRRLGFTFEGERYEISTPAIMLLSFVVGIIGGTYGIGGGAIIAPFLVTVFGLPVYTIAGAALMGTFLTSIVGVLFFAFVAPELVAGAVPVRPDWLLGLLFGAGGAVGMYLGALLQRFIPARLIKLLLALLIAIVVLKYLLEAL